MTVKLTFEETMEMLLGRHKTNFGGPENPIFRTTVQAWLAIAHWQSALLQEWWRVFDPRPEGEFFVFVFVLLSELIAHLKPRARGVL